MDVMTEIVKWTGNEHLTSGHDKCRGSRWPPATESLQRHLYKTWTEIKNVMPNNTTGSA